MTIDGLLNRLLGAGIERLVDVRSNPVARRYGFHKSTLAKLCPKVRIEYVHRPEVGVPSEWRSALGSPESYRSLFERYACEVLPKAEGAMRELTELAKSKPSAFMCREADPALCHRTTLVAALGARTGLDVIEVPGEEADALF